MEHPAAWSCPGPVYFRSKESIKYGSCADFMWDYKFWTKLRAVTRFSLAKGTRYSVGTEQFWTFFAVLLVREHLIPKQTYQHDNKGICYGDGKWVELKSKRRKNNLGLCGRFMPQNASVRCLRMKMKVDVAIVAKKRNAFCWAFGAILAKPLKPPKPSNRKPCGVIN